MVDERDSPDRQVEHIFDVTKRSAQLEFLGFIDGVAGSGNNLSGLFQWKCDKCGAINHDAAIIETGRSFLAEWSCNRCDEAMHVHFRTRPITDWIAQHTLAITTKALSGATEEENSSESSSSEGRQSAEPNQKTFAWIAIPLLALLIVVGSADLKHLRSSFADGRGPSGRASGPSYSWLGGYWVGEEPGDALYFGYMNPAARCGAYTIPAHNGKPAQIVRFEILREEAMDDRLVLRELNKSPQADDPGAVIHITRDDGRMVRMTTRGGEPVLNTYRHADRPSKQ